MLQWNSVGYAVGIILKHLSLSFSLYMYIPKGSHG